jgi:hypothetical protein
MSIPDGVPTAPKPTKTTKTAGIRVSSKTTKAQEIPPTSSSSSTKSSAKGVEISLDDFTSLNIEDIQQSTWGAKYTVPMLKKLYTALGLPSGKQKTKAQLIDGLITYKQSGGAETTTAFGGGTFGATNNTVVDENEVDESQPTVALKPKRRVLAAPIVQQTIEIIKKHNLNLVLCDDDNILLVLSDDKQLVGFITKESYEDDSNTPSVLAPTKKVIFLAKNLSINYDASEISLDS